MQKNAASQSGIFNPRVLLAFTLCSVGALLAMFSLAATPPVETTHANTSVPPDSRNFLSTFGSNANHLPPGAPLPPGTQFSLNGQGDPLKQQPTAGFLGFTEMPFRPGTARGANSLGTPRFANQQPAPLSVPQAAASESMPLVSGAQSNDWSIVSSPNTSATQHNALRGVTCVSTSECWAVGYYLSDNAAQTLIERWDGTSWSIVSSPNTSTTEANVLLGVTCVSASECWAVGYYYGLDDLISQTLIERWDGTSWAIVSSPNTNTQSNLLLGVTCGSASDCWAVVYDAFTGGVLQTLIERWDGTSWAIVTSPNTSTTQSNFLYGVTCGSASDCWAVGYYYNASSVAQTLVLRYTASPGEITLSANGHRVRGMHTVDLSWTGAMSPNVDIYRDGVVIATVSNTGAYTDSIGVRGGNVRYMYKVCEAGTQTCSNEVTVRFGGPPL